MKWDLIELSVNFLQMFVIYKTLELYYVRRFYFKYSVEILMIVMTAMLSILNYNLSIELYPYMYIFFYFLIYLTTVLIFKGNIFSKAITIFLIMAFIGACELLAAVFIFSITGLDFKLHQEQNFIRFEGMVISQTLLIYTYMFLKKTTKKERLNLFDNRYYFLVGSILFLTITLIVMVIWMYGNIEIQDESINNSLVVFTLCVSIISIITIALTNKIIKDMNEKHKNDLELQQMKMEHAYFTDVNSVLEEIRILRHDMRGELAIIHAYNELDQRDNIRIHIEKKLREIDIQLMPQIDKDNIITSFLNFKLKEAKCKGIDVVIESKLTEENEIHIDKEDICRVLNNIINNAIEACNECEECIEKYIKLDIDMIGRSIIIKSENPYSGELNKEGNKILTIKKDKTRHGYGLKSIKGIAEKYGGFMKLSYDDRVFVIEVHMLTKI
ncbi:sensor histidine kinase [Sedimentibacter hydroxybenzoicus DSM 7310]|uniref:Sensor histidine kinase n=1 Tax=Sedimentibacter hydroxybenzoicus DSM 7310 TaxID=1123245 RepID=A0A974BJU7_SEDHY|nr:ATP-binding protein [Sedimentibacter hydroxybenzoicus]NYB74206.1 sensor histidine kinase [Sedimentibacter hydroxybenzoicus DSM 7310]